MSGVAPAGVALRALLLEDSADDALLLERHLARSGYRLEGRRVETLEDFRAALVEPWELVLADYHLTTFTALDALAVFRTQPHDIPFLIVSGAMGEDVGVTAMLHGAQDYIFKGNLSRLVPAIERELREAAGRRQNRAAQEALHRAEDQLAQAQKMEAIGRLAGGVAHDFNNVLSIIGNYAALCLADPQDGALLRMGLGEIGKAASRAAKLTQQLLTFSRRHPAPIAAVDLNRVVRDLEGMLRSALGADVELVLLLAPGTGAVRGDAVQLEQVLMNLAVNARDAMPHGGRLVIETGRARDEGRVALTVADTGVGVAPDVLPHIFEPFFTTKAEGRGTGLGLATVYGIVTGWGGEVAVDSAPGRGAVFRVLLPGASMPASEAPRSIPAAVRGGGERVLVVEDDDAVRTLVCELLQRHGYAVLTARNAGEAILLAEQHGRSIDLMLTDIVMPHMSGLALAARLAPMLPEMPVVYMSGYADAQLQGGGLAPDMRLLTKPFTVEGLTAMVREALDARAVSAEYSV